MDFKAKVGTLLADAGQGAKDKFEKAKDVALQVVDKDGDGKFDLADIAAAADAVKQGAQDMAVFVEERARQHQLDTLRPVFSDTLEDANFLMPKFIRIVERDKKYSENPACKGAIGFRSGSKNLTLLNIFWDSVDAFGLSFYPDRTSEFYYIDPTDRDGYIALDDYFEHLKTARVNELQKIAQDLGAKHFRVTFKEEAVAFSSQKGKVAGKIGHGGIVGDHAEENERFSMVSVEAEMSFPGRDPVEPKLKYLKNDDSIKTLISMRMDKTAPLLHQKIAIKMSSSSGLKESDAAKIDAVLKGLKCAGNASVSSEAKRESRKFLEYEIDF